MIEILLTCIFISSAICGLYLASEPNMILQPFHDFIEQRINWAYKPLIGCVTCMASVWGSIMWFVVRGMDSIQVIDIVLWPIAVLAIAFSNTLLIRLT